MDWVSRTDLIDPPTLKALAQRSDAKGLVHLASHLGALGIGGYALWLTWGGWWGVPIFIVHGYLLNALFATQHECNHQTAFRSRWLNDAVRRFTGFVQIYPAWWEAWFHFAHHRYTGDWTKDAELLQRGKYTLGNYLFFLSGAGYWYYRIQNFWAYCWAVPGYAHWLTGRQRRYVLWEHRGHLAGYLAVAVLSIWFESWLALTLWLLPMVLTKPLHQFQNLGEHLGLEDGGLDTTKNTRTLDVPGFVRWALWNMPYHAAHHTFPGVPFHRLPELHRVIESRLGRPLPKAGYLETAASVIRAARRGPEETWQIPFAAGGSRNPPLPRASAAE